MRFKRIHVIINPASGTDEPILSYLNKILRPANVSWDVSVTHKSGDCARFTKEALTNGNDAIAVYGGDGTVIEAAHVLYKTSTPLIVLPGGTANVFAKEIGIPPNPQDAILLITQPRKQKIMAIDMGLVNDQPFLIRIDIGSFADIVADTGRELKNRLGRLAYSVTTVKNIVTNKHFTFKLNLDGKILNVRGEAMAISNAGNIGIGNISLHPNISISDGFLDAVLVKNFNLSSLIDVAKVNLSNRPVPHPQLRHWRIKNAEIILPNNSRVICDDLPISVTKLSIKIDPKSLNVLTQKS